MTNQIISKQLLLLFLVTHIGCFEINDQIVIQTKNLNNKILDDYKIDFDKNIFVKQDIDIALVKNDDLITKFVLPVDWKCNHKGLFKLEIPNEKLCEIVSKHCPTDVYNFLKLYYCSFDQSLFGMIIFGIVVIYLIFIYTEEVVENSITPGLEGLNEMFGITPGVSAITILSFSNGADEVVIFFPNFRLQQQFPEILKEE